MHLADAFTQSDLQLHSGYTFSSVCVFPGNRTHNLLRCWRNALPLSHTGADFTWSSIYHTVVVHWQAAQIQVDNERGFLQLVSEQRLCVVNAAPCKKTEKHCLLNSCLYCIYFLQLLVIWLSVEKMFSTEPIVAFLDLCSCYIFWLHLWVNKNVDGCLE